MKCRERRNFSLLGKGERINGRIFKNHGADPINCIFINGAVGEYFTLSLGMDDLRCNGLGSICSNAYFAI